MVSLRVLLVVDGEAGLTRTVADALRAPQYEVRAAPWSQALVSLCEHDPDVVLLAGTADADDVTAALLAAAHTRDSATLGLVARDDEAAVTGLFDAGVDDCVGLPLHADEIRARVRVHAGRRRALQQVEIARQDAAGITEELQRRTQELEDEIAHGERLAERLAAHAGGVHRRRDAADFIGQSQVLQDTLAKIGRLQGATIPVLITGESGTGKELMARALHFGGGRADGPFVPVNCSAIPESLAESLFFGHRRGAFSGADRDRQGYFELAHGGSLFLDEVGDMPLDLQAKLLRVLEDGRVQPVGAKETLQVEVRIIAATNVDLQSRIRSGRLREDLYFRLARYPVHVPPLRERRDDIPLLARHFLRAFAEEICEPAPDLGDEVVRILQAYEFPGNVRELRNIVERALIECGGASIEPRHVHLGFEDAAPYTVPPPAPRPAPAAQDMPLDFAAAELLLIRRALNLAGGNITEAARMMGINRTRIYRRLAAAEAAASAAES